METRGNFFWLLISLLLILVVYPIFEGSAFTGKMFALFFSGVLLAGVYVVSRDNKKLFRTSIILAAPAMIAIWLEEIMKGHVLDVVALVTVVLFSWFTVFCIISYLMKARKVTADILAGAASAYLLLGISWSLLYYLVEIIIPGSFQMAGEMLAVGGDKWNIFNYFSFTTLTTLGYGDVVPVTARAQSLAILEAVSGVLFTALLISRLVGMYLFHAREERVQS